MPASTKKVTKPSVKAVAKATTKVLAKPARKGTRSLSTAEAARKLAKSPAAAAANAAIVAAREPKADPAPVGGAKGRIIAMIAAKGGTSAAEVCKALGWARAGATIGRAIKLAGFKVAKVRDADGVLRYSRAN